MIQQKVRIVKKHAEEPGQMAQVFDAETGKRLENIRGIHMRMRVDDLPVVTIEQYPSDIELDVEALAEIRGPGEHAVIDKRGEMWVNGTWLAKLIRDGGTLCHKSGQVCVSHDFSDDLLKEWEGIKIGPSEGHNQEQNHGK